MSSSFRRAAPRRQKQSNVNSIGGEKAPVPSSFDGRTPSTVLERIGTKPSKGGLTLTSSGLRELDAIIGGGQPLGTAILIEEDRWTQDLALALARYWSAEAVCQGQNLSLLATAPDLDISSVSVSGESDFHLQQYGMNTAVLEQFITLLPKNLHLEKLKKEKAKQIQSETPSTNSTSIVTPQEDFAIIEENEEDFDEEGENERMDGSNDKDEEILQNAWQYKLSVQRERRAEHSSQSKSLNANANMFCHSYDLSGRLRDQFPDTTWDEQKQLISIVQYPHDRPNTQTEAYACNGVQLLKTCVQHIKETLSQKPNGVIRLLIMNAPVNTTALALPLLLSHIRSHALPVVVLVTVRPWILSKESTQLQSLVALRRTCDAIFTCEGFDAIVTPPPSEFSDLAGIFSIRKMALQALAHFADSTTNRRPPANRYGMKRDRRKLHIRMLHLPPEDFSAGGSSVGGGVRSGGGRPNQQDDGSKGKRTALQPGMGCASNIPGKASSLDF